MCSGDSLETATVTLGTTNTMHVDFTLGFNSNSSLDGKCCNHLQLGLEVQELSQVWWRRPRLEVFHVLDVAKGIP